MDRDKRVETENSLSSIVFEKTSFGIFLVGFASQQNLSFQSIFDLWSSRFIPLSDVPSHIVVAGVLLFINLLFGLGASFAFEIARFRWSEFQLLLAVYIQATEFKRRSSEEGWSLSLPSRV